MKIFKAIIYSILLLIWVVFTILFVVTIIPIVTIAVCGMDEWFEYQDNILYEFKKL